MMQGDMIKVIKDLSENHFFSYRHVTDPRLSQTEIKMSATAASSALSTAEIEASASVGAKRRKPMKTNKVPQIQVGKLHF